MNDTTYAVYGEKPDGTRDYIGTYDAEPLDEFVESWADEYPTIIVSADTFSMEHGDWQSVETRYPQEQE